jgi:gas vesicle protein
MALQLFSFGKTTNNSFLTPGLLAGAITLCCGVTASFFSPSSKVMGALAGGAVGSVGVTILKKRHDQELKDIVKNELKSHVSLLNHDIAALTGEINQLKTQVKAAAKLPITASLESNVINDDVKTTSDNVADLIALLHTHQVKVESYKRSLPIDELLDNLAVTLGKEYASLEPLHQQIIRSLQTGRKLSFSLANSSQAMINICTQFCQNLHGKSLLESYHYDKKQKVIYATPQTGNPEITQFLTGGWFERFVYQKVANLLKSQGIKFQSLRNVHISLKNQDKFELDLLFLVNQQLIWIECKAGQQSSSYLKSYCDRKKFLVIPKERALLVSLKLSDAQTASWTKLWDITVANSNNFLDSINHALNAKPVQSYDVQNCSELAKLLKQKKLRSLPEYRHKIIDELVKIFADSNQILTMNQAKQKIALALEFDNSKVHEILNAVIHANCLVDEHGNIVTSFMTPISALLFSETAIIENRCVELYASIALSLDINYFNYPHNIAEFERIIGARIPDTSIIDQLKEQQKINYPKLMVG